jgi:hypothetical protein
MVDNECVEYEVVLTPQFLDDLSACVNYVSESLSSPQTAKRMYEGVRDKVLALSIMPQAAASYLSPLTRSMRYVVSYGRYDIHYYIEGSRVKVLGLKHQLQNKKWVN